MFADFTIPRTSNSTAVEQASMQKDKGIKDDRSETMLNDDSTMRSSPKRSPPGIVMSRHSNHSGVDMRNRGPPTPGN